MRRFSIGTAIGDAFRLIRRRPLAVFVWGLLTVAPFVIGFALILPVMGDMFANMPAPGSDPAGYEDAFPDQAFAQMMQFQMASMLMNIGQLLVMAVVYTAIMRAMLHPRETSFFSLRIGMDELRVAVVGLAIGVVMYIAMIILALFAVALAVALGLGMSGSDPGVVVSVVVVLAIVAAIGFLWAMARVSLMAPASVLYRDFAFVQGWKLASGKGWPLFGMMLLILVIVLLIEAVLVMIGVGLFAGFAAASGPLAEMAAAAEPFSGLAAWLAANWYWAALGALAASLFYGVVLTLGIAPYASACRQLAESGAPKPVEEAASPESAA